MLNAHVRLASTDNIFVLGWKGENNNEMLCLAVFAKYFIHGFLPYFYLENAVVASCLRVNEIFGAIGGLHDNREDSTRFIGCSVFK